MGKQQIIFIHGGNSYHTREEYLHYLRSVEVDPYKEVRKRWSWELQEMFGDGYEVLNPQMPCKQSAHYDEWSIWFERHVPFMHDGAVLIGHSLGANFLAKYLSEHETPFHIKSLHLIAGCYGSPTFELLSDFSLIESQVDRIVLYHSKDDPVVPYANFERYVQALSSAQQEVFEDRGHFLSEEFPELIANIRNSE